MKKCNCVDIEVGSYGNQIILQSPPHVLENLKRLGYAEKDDDRDFFYVDTCIAQEIKHLWSLGITTTGCCCGHNKVEPYIGVIPEDIRRMKILGYDVHFNSSRPGAEDSFIPHLLSSSPSTKAE